MKRGIWNTHPSPENYELRQMITRPTKPRFFLDVETQKQPPSDRAPYRAPSSIASALKDRYEECDCEVCGWTPPAPVKHRFLDWRSIMHAHHILPRSCGGADVKENIIIVCPICHALAHRLGRIIRDGNRPKKWSGLTTRKEVIAEIRDILGVTTGATTEPVLLESALTGLRK